MLNGQHVLPEGMDCAADGACRLARVRSYGEVGGDGLEQRVEVEDREGCAGISRTILWRESLRLCLLSVLFSWCLVVGKRLVAAAIDEGRSRWKVAHLQQRSSRTDLQVYKRSQCYV